MCKEETAETKGGLKYLALFSFMLLFAFKRILF